MKSRQMNSHQCFSRRAFLALAGISSLSMAGLVGCGSNTQPQSQSATSQTAAESSYSPVTIEHMYGSTTVQKLPQKIVCLGWGSTDALLSLGVIPYAMNRQETNVDGKMVIFPWIQDELKKLGASEGSESYPKLLSDKDGQPIQEVASFQPDLICAKISGITQEEYDQLSKIAPVIAPMIAWQDGWEPTLDAYAQVLKLEEKAAAVKDSIKNLLQDMIKKHPEWNGKTYATGCIPAAGKWSAYSPKDNRSVMFKNLGFTLVPAVKQAFEKESQFYLDWPSERLGEINPDVMWSWVIDQKTFESLAKDPVMSQMPAIKEGHAILAPYDTDMPYVSAVSNTSALSIPWVLPRLEKDIDKVLKK